MSVVTPKRIKHLARYFGILAIICLLGYACTGFAYPFLVFVGPPIFLTYWLRTQGGLLVQWLPNEPLVNHLFLFAPLTVVYFGLVGFQLKNILNERGIIRTLILIAFLGFLIYLHSLAFQELSLYWKGSDKLAPAAFQ